MSVSLSVAATDLKDQKNQDPIAIQPPADMVPDNLIWLDTSNLEPHYVFVADKENRTLSVWHRDGQDFSLYGAFPMDIGKNVGDKNSPGDAKTPEGAYIIQTRLEGKTLNFGDYGVRAFTLDYPNYFDHLAKKTGSGIWLHAIPDTKSLLRGSRGCVVVRNEIIQKLTPLIALKKTPLIIVNRVNYVTRDKIAEIRKSLTDWLTGWQNAWQNKDLEKYISHYSDSFNGEYKTLKMSKRKWYEYKAFLAKKYSFIKVNLGEPYIITRKDDAIIRFIQNYESDSLKDSGEKTLYLRRNSSGHYEILTELWTALNDNTLIEGSTAPAGRAAK